jgi:uncharacterized protein (DUF2147 family)
MKFIILIGSLLLFSSSTFFNNSTESDAIIGVWKHESSESKIQIYKTDNQYFGKVITAVNGVVNGKLTLDVKNPEPALRKRPIHGLVILSNFTYSGKNLWEKGEIYDSRAGKTYSCRLTLQGNETLIVRGFIQAPIFGKNEIFKRVE